MSLLFLFDFFLKLLLIFSYMLLLKIYLSVNEFSFSDYKIDDFAVENSAVNYVYMLFLCLFCASFAYACTVSVFFYNIC